MMIDIIDVAFAVFLGNVITLIFIWVLLQIFNDNIDAEREYKHAKRGRIWY